MRMTKSGNSDMVSYRKIREKQCHEAFVISEREHQGLIVIADGSEAMDVLTCSSVLYQFGMKMVIASFDTNSTCHLKGGVSLLPDCTFQEARTNVWSVLILPGGARGVSKLMESENFVCLLKQHVEVHGNLIGGLGAGGTYILRSMSYVSEFGPTCLPPTRSSVVVNERDGQIWTTPGLSTAPYLALTLGEQIYGFHKCKAVARTLSLAPLSGSNTTEDAAHEETVGAKNPIQRISSLTETMSDHEGTIVSFEDRLFEHIVWHRLEQISWKRTRKNTKSNRSLRPFSYQPPQENEHENEVIKGKQEEVLISPDRVIRFLQYDPVWSRKKASFRILDLFLSCRRIQKGMKVNAESPEAVEQETKRRMPALLTY